MCPWTKNVFLTLIFRGWGFGCPGLAVKVDIIVSSDCVVAEYATYIAECYQLWDQVCVVQHLQMS